MPSAWASSEYLRLPYDGHHLEGVNLVYYLAENHHLQVKPLDLTWGEAQHPAHNRQKWRLLILALCPTEDEEAY